MPDLVLTSDVIIGFPGETEAEAMETVALVEEVRFDALFTFIFSPRPGTPAARMDDPVPRAEKQEWFDRLCDAQNRISEEIHAGYVGDTLRCLIDGESNDRGTAGASGGRPSRDRHLPRRKDHRQQHVGAVRRAGINFPTKEASPWQS